MLTEEESRQHLIQEIEKVKASDSRFDVLALGNALCFNRDKLATDVYREFEFQFPESYELFLENHRHQTFRYKLAEILHQIFNSSFIDTLKIKETFHEYICYEHSLQLTFEAPSEVKEIQETALSWAISDWLTFGGDFDQYHLHFCDLLRLGLAGYTLESVEVTQSLKGDFWSFNEEIDDNSQEEIDDHDHEEELV